MKLIISGVPCCGKTYFGDWLRDHHGFTHVNLEHRQRNGRYVIPPQDLRLDWIVTLATKIVVTWAFPPPEGIRAVKMFEAAGFTPWWFSADHAVARARAVERDGEATTKQYFDAQVGRMTDSEAALKSLYQDRSVGTLSGAGYMTPEEINKIIQRRAF